MSDMSNQIAIYACKECNGYYIFAGGLKWHLSLDPPCMQSLDIGERHIEEMHELRIKLKQTKKVISAYKKYLDDLNLQLQSNALYKRADHLDGGKIICPVFLLIRESRIDDCLDDYEMTYISLYYDTAAGISSDEYIKIRARYFANMRILKVAIIETDQKTIEDNNKLISAMSNAHVIETRDGETPFIHIQRNKINEFWDQFILKKQ